MFLMDLQGSFFLIRVTSQALNQFLEVDLVGVEFGAVNTGEFSFVADRHSATSTHAQTADHYRVQADHGLDAVGTSHF